MNNSKLGNPEVLYQEVNPWAPDGGLNEMRRQQGHMQRRRQNAFEENLGLAFRRDLKTMQEDPRLSFRQCFKEHGGPQDVSKTPIGESLKKGAEKMTRQRTTESVVKRPASIYSVNL